MKLKNRKEDVLMIPTDLYFQVGLNLKQTIQL
jgi:hypothetical protein